MQQQALLSALLLPWRRDLQAHALHPCTPDAPLTHALHALPHHTQVYTTLTLALAVLCVGITADVFTHVGGLLTTVAGFGALTWLTLTPATPDNLVSARQLNPEQQQQQQQQTQQLPACTPLTSATCLPRLHHLHHRIAAQTKRYSLLGAFAFCQGTSLGPLVGLALALQPSVLLTAALATTAIFACFSLSALLTQRRCAASRTHARERAVWPLPARQRVHAWRPGSSSTFGACMHGGRYQHSRPRQRTRSPTHPALRLRPPARPCLRHPARRSLLFLGGWLGSAVTGLLLLRLGSWAFGFRAMGWAFDAELYVGLLVFAGYVLFDTQLIVERASAGDFDHVRHALDVFVDFVALAVRVLVVLLRNAEKREAAQRQGSRRRRSDE